MAEDRHAPNAGRHAVRGPDAAERWQRFLRQTSRRSHDVGPLIYPASPDDRSGFPHYHMDAHKHGFAGPVSAEQYEQIEKIEQTEREKIERANKEHAERDFAARARRDPK